MSSQDSKNIPLNISIIMDGNGRWALQKGLPRIKGHEQGAQVAKNIVEEAVRLKLKEITLYSLSLDNLNRPYEEISALLNLFDEYLTKEKETIMNNNIRFLVIGRTWLLPVNIQEKMHKLIDISSKNNGLILRLAINYSGKMEIIDAVNKIILANNKNEINENEFRKFLYDPQMEEPDLLIRTGGQFRISDFLLWYISYTELWFTNILWPDFTTDLFHHALNDYSKRKRKFGKTI